MAKHGANVCGIVAYLTDASILTKIMAMAANPAFFDDSWFTDRWNIVENGLFGWKLEITWFLISTIEISNSRNTPSLDLKPSLFLLAMSKNIMVKLVDIMVISNWRNFLTFRKKLTPSDPAPWFLQKNPPLQDIRILREKKIHGWFLDQFYSICVKNGLTWLRLVKRLFLSIYFGLANWDFCRYFFLAFRRSPPPDPSAVCQNAFRQKSQ